MNLSKNKKIFIYFIFICFSFDFENDRPPVIISKTAAEKIVVLLYNKQSSKFCRVLLIVSPSVEKKNFPWLLGSLSLRNCLL